LRTGVGDLSYVLDQFGNVVSTVDNDMKSFSDGALRDFEDRISSEDFQESFNRLDAASKNFTKNALAGFRDAAGAGNATEETVRQLQSALEAVGLVGGSALDSVNDSLSRLGEPTGAEQEVSRLHERVQELSGSGSAASAAVAGLATATGDVNTQAPGAAQGVKDLGAAAEQAKEPLEALQGGASAISDSLSEISDAGSGVSTLLDSLSANQEALTAAGETSTALSASLPDVAAAVAIIGEQAPALAAAVPTILMALQEANDEETLATVATDIGALGEAATKLSDATGFEPALEAISELSDKSEDVEKLGVALQSLAASQAELAKLGTELGTVAEHLKEVIASATELGDESGPLKAARQQLEAFGEFLGGDFKTQIEETVALVASLKESFEGIGSAAERARERVETAFGGITSASKAMVESLRADLAEMQSLIDQMEAESARGLQAVERDHGDGGTQTASNNPQGVDFSTWPHV